MGEREREGGGFERLEVEKKGGGGERWKWDERDWGEMWRGGWLRIERKGGRRGGWLGWRCSLIVEILEVFLLEGWRGGFFSFSLFLVFSFSFPLSPPLYHVDVNLLTFLVRQISKTSKLAKVDSHPFTTPSPP